MLKNVGQWAGIGRVSYHLGQYMIGLLYNMFNTFSNS